ncbi:MAG: NAD-dependent protein deacetylase of SIR2 family, partial [Chloroflexota bacterium]
YFSQGSNPLYEQLRRVIGEKDYFVMTSNVDELFHKSGFDPERIYTPQGSYGRIQCTVPCRPDSLWDIRPFFERMQQAYDPVEQILTDPAAIPRCPNCSESMFVNARIDGSFIETPYELERDKFVAWINQAMNKKLVLLEMGAGYNTPVVIRMPMESITQQVKDASFIRVNWEYAQVPMHLEPRGVSVQGDIKEFVEKVDQQISLVCQ